MMRPIALPPNLVHHFYAGGARIAGLRGIAPADHTPEEWIGAVNTTFDGSRGLSSLPDGELVRDAIARDPTGFLGPEHVSRHGTDPCLLVKLLDAGQRLPVHFHPGRRFARRHLGLEHGKTEAWVIVDAEPGASVHVGFAEAVDLSTVRDWMAAQDANALLGALRELPVAAGDAVFVPAGTPHAIGEGILLVELQEPTDLSVMLEWETFGLSGEDAHLGLGWEAALEALDTSAWDDERLAGLTGGGEGGSLLPPGADAFFRAERVRGGDELDPGFAILIGIAGSGELGGAPFGRGDAVLVPYGAGTLALTGDAEAIRCRPPVP